MKCRAVPCLPFFLPPEIVAVFLLLLRLLLLLLLQLPLILPTYYYYYYYYYCIPVCSAFYLSLFEIACSVRPICFIIFLPFFSFLCLPFLLYCNVFPILTDDRDTWSTKRCFRWWWIDRWMIFIEGWGCQLGLESPFTRRLVIFASPRILCMAWHWTTTTRRDIFWAKRTVERYGTCLILLCSLGHAGMVS